MTVRTATRILSAGEIEPKLQYMRHLCVMADSIPIDDDSRALLDEADEVEQDLLATLRAYGAVVTVAERYDAAFRDLTDIGESSDPPDEYYGAVDRWREAGVDLCKAVSDMRAMRSLPE